MVTDKYVIWSDGSFTSMGIECADCDSHVIGKKMIKNPASIVFNITQTIATIKTSKGKIEKVCMLQKWPVRKGRPYKLGNRCI